MAKPTCTLVAIIGFIGSLMAQSAAAQEPAELIAEAEFGPYAVGFTAMLKMDPSGPFSPANGGQDDPAGDLARPIQMFVWYPVAGSPQDLKLPYGEYIQLSDILIEPWQQTPDQMQAAVDAYINGAENPDALRAILPDLIRTPTMAYRDADPAEGPFPLIVFGSGGNTPAYIHASLCEYLASHGYVALALPSIPLQAGERWPFDHTGLELQVRDMEFAVGVARGWSNVDQSRFGLLAWSVGGVSQLLLQMTNPAVGALVSIDSGSGYRYGVQMARDSARCDSTRVSVPYLHAHGLAPARYEVEKDFTVYESWSTARRHLITFDDLSHSEFRSHSVLELMLMNSERAPVVVASYRILARSIRLFLDDHIGGRDTAAEDFESVRSTALSAGVQIESMD